MHCTHIHNHTQDVDMAKILVSYSLHSSYSLRAILENPPNKRTHTHKLYARTTFRGYMFDHTNIVSGAALLQQFEHNSTNQVLTRFQIVHGYSILQSSSFCARRFGIQYIGFYVIDIFTRWIWNRMNECRLLFGVNVFGAIYFIASFKIFRYGLRSEMNENTFLFFSWN